MAYTDGACWPNPGRGGWGVVLIGEVTGERFAEFSGFDPGPTTSNRMELMAVIEALRAIKGPARIYTDSELTRNCALRHWKRKANRDLWELYDLTAAGRRVEVIWVKGHAGDRWNERADELANAAVSCGRSGVA
ncbi:MAG: ribonuclease H, partial [Sulfuricaulis sp.]|nr:ribonuclease H [Sulfuricaulis sp.]